MGWILRTLSTIFSYFFGFLGFLGFFQKNILPLFSQDVKISYNIAFCYCFELEKTTNLFSPKTISRMPALCVGFTYWAMVLGRTSLTVSIVHAVILVVL